MLKKFSIITVVYNAKDDLAKTVQSIQSQNLNLFEHIIVDGGSTDGTLEYIQSLNHKNIDYISEKDKGIYDAMNKGIDLSTGEYLLFLNAADTFASDKTLEIVFDRIIENKTDIIYGGSNVYTENGKFLTSLKPLSFSKKNLNKYATRTACHQSIFVHKSIVKHYSDKYRLKGELNWYYELLESSKEISIVKLDNMICNYYLGGTGDKNFLENYFERLNVTWMHCSLLEFSMNMPFLLIPFIFRIRRIIFGK